MELPHVRLKIERRSNHPWIFQKMVDRPERLPAGTIVDILDRAGTWVGRGFYNGHSRIALRVLTEKQDEAIDDAFLARKIANAIGLRKETLKLDAVSDAYRLVHSEGDGLSGLVVDRFGPMLVLEFFSAGMFRLRSQIQEILTTHFPGATFYAFAEEHVQKQESFDFRAPEPPAPFIITEHGLRFRVAPGSKHKTGFFVDQRDNRKMLAEFCEGKKVLDLCCNSGGFSVYAKTLGKAEEVIGVDLDESVIPCTAQKKREDQNQARVRFVQADLFAWIRDVLPTGQRFDVVVLDPAKQTRSKEEIDLALKKYLDMNLALRPQQRRAASSSRVRAVVSTSARRCSSTPSASRHGRRARDGADSSASPGAAQPGPSVHGGSMWRRGGIWKAAVWCRVE